LFFKTLSLKFQGRRGRSLGVHSGQDNVGSDDRFYAYREFSGNKNHRPLRPRNFKERFILLTIECQKCSDEASLNMSNT